MSRLVSPSRSCPGFINNDDDKNDDGNRFTESCTNGFASDGGLWRVRFGGGVVGADNNAPALTDAIVTADVEGTTASTGGPSILRFVDTKDTKCEGDGVSTEVSDSARAEAGGGDGGDNADSVVSSRFS